MNAHAKFRLLALLCAMFTACVARGMEGEKNVRDNRKKIGVLVFQNVLTSDVTAPLEVFGAAAMEPTFPYRVVAISAEESKTITTQEGLKLTAQYLVSEKPELAVLIVPGAYDLKKLYANRELMNFLKEQGAKTEFLASNCAGAFLLARAGLLKGKKATTWRGGEKELQQLAPGGEIRYNTNLVVDGRLITSNGGIVSYQAAMVLLEKLAKPAVVKKVSEAIAYRRAFASVN